LIQVLDRSHRRSHRFRSHRDGIGENRRQQRLAAVRQHHQQLRRTVPVHPAQHPQQPALQRMSIARNSYRRRKVLDTSSKSRFPLIGFSMMR
jgi:hypothetical protein